MHQLAKEMPEVLGRTSETRTGLYPANSTCSGLVEVSTEARAAPRGSGGGGGGGEGEESRRGGGSNP